MEHEFERQLRALAIERRPEACLGCGFEHGCSVHGCAVIHAAVNRLAAYEETRLEPEDMKKAFNEDATLKLAGQILGVTPGRLRKLAQAEKADEIGKYRFYYCESEDEYLIGARLDTFYYARWDGSSFTWSMSRYLPWGQHVVAPETAWKEYTYPSEPKEIGISEWFKGFLGKLTREAAEAALKEREDVPCKS